MIAFTLLALFAFTGVQSALEFTYKCPDNYTPYENECHQIFKTKVTWENAKTECEENHDAHLARIKDVAENEHLSEKVAGEDDAFWIDLNRKGADDYKDFKYSPPTEISYEYRNWFWLNPKIKAVSGDCVLVKDNGKWTNINCNDDGDKYYYVCEKDAIKTPVCPEGYKFNDLDEEEINACYKPSDEGVKAIYTTANDACVTEGAYLYFPTTKAERDFVNDLVDKDHWIGINDIGIERTYTTSLGGEMEYKNWCYSYYGSWSKDKDDCVLMDARLLWNCFSNRNCAQTHPYVCKMI